MREEKTELVSVLSKKNTEGKNVSAKQPPSKSRRDWYPYYAGFTEKFVKNVLIEHLSSANRILDPWSGSGTTTAVCIKRELISKGIDINPAMTVIARARLTPTTMKLELIQLADHILDVAKRSNATVQSSDLLALWVKADALCNIRCIQNAIHDVCMEDKPKHSCNNLGVVVDGFSTALCFYYTALFAAVRNLLSEFRTTNPMWIKAPANPKARIDPSQNQLLQQFRQSVASLAELLSVPKTKKTNGEMSYETADVTCIPYGTNTFDAVLSSPPYATRLDYIKGTLPELAILGAEEPVVSNLRKKATGSPVVRHVEGRFTEPLSSEFANDLLDKIRSHPSKGSRAYYYPWMRNYLYNLQKGLEEIHRTVKQEGAICIVVQDSRYKELHINLQRIVMDVLESQGRMLTKRIDHAAPNPRFSEVQFPSSCKGEPTNNETLLVFGEIGK